MCLLLVAHDCCPGYRLVVAANRDEFHARPTAPADAWADAPHIYGGRDLEAGGTWLAVDQRGRFATITNVRTGKPTGTGARSRGLIVRDFLDRDDDAETFAAALARDAHDYEGFNVLAYDGRALSWFSNAVGDPRALARGIYTLSNAALDTVWPKTARLRDGFGEVIERQHGDIVDHLLELLGDPRSAAAHELPDTGVGHAMERVLSSIFIRGEAYGTRCSTVILIDEQDHLEFHERRYDAAGSVVGDTRVRFELDGPGR